MRIRTAMAMIGTVALVAAVGTTGAAQADRGSGSRGGGGSETIEIEDDCDPETFNVAVAPGTCVGDGDTEFEEFIDELLEEGEAGKWRNHPDDTHVDEGERVKLKNVGGEAHTFTRVDAFGGGCVPELNDVLGLAPAPDAVCGAAFAGILLPGQSATVPATDLHEGHNLFQCMIHPWMHAEIEVRGHDHH
jgi:hypothetical protein